MQGKRLRIFRGRDTAPMGGGKEDVPRSAGKGLRETKGLRESRGIVRRRAEKQVEKKAGGMCWQMLRKGLRNFRGARGKKC